MGKALIGLVLSNPKNIIKFRIILFLTVLDILIKTVVIDSCGFSKIELTLNVKLMMIMSIVVSLFA